MLCCSHFRELVVCKAVSLDIASMEERFFFHSLRYTLINLLKAATPVSSSLTHLKRQTALNPTRIFSMDASARKKKKKEKNRSSPATDSFLSQGLKMKRKERQAHSSSFLLMAVGQRGSCRGVMKPRLIGLLLSIACMHPLPTRQQPRPFQTDLTVYC